MKPSTEIKTVSHRCPTTLRNLPRSRHRDTLTRRMSRLMLTLGMALCAGSASVQAQTWETVDDVSPYSAAFGATADRAGNLFVAGYMRDAANLQHAVIMKSSDAGQTWDSDPSTPEVDEPSDSIPPPTGGSGVGAKAWFEGVASARVADGAGGFADHLVAFGKSQPPVLNSNDPYHIHWIIRRSLDGGVTWQTIDDYQHPTYDLVPLAPNNVGGGVVAVDSSGTVWVTGLAVERTVSRGKTVDVSHWLVRKGVTQGDGTVQWTTTDFVVPASSEYYRTGNVFPSGVACAGSNVYVMGGGGTEGACWRVMKSGNGGTTWTVADNFRLDAKDASHAYSMASDSAGSLYVAGWGNAVSQNTLRSHWIVRKGSPGGTGWTTVDQYQYPGSNGWARGIAVAPNGDVHVTGYGGGSPRRWITRQRSAATGLWSTTDDFVHPVNPRTFGNAITADPFGNVFSAGFAGSPADGSIFTLHNWLVRRKLAPAAP